MRPKFRLTDAGTHVFGRVWVAGHEVSGTFATRTAATEWATKAVESYGHVRVDEFEWDGETWRAAVHGDETWRTEKDEIERLDAQVWKLEAENRRLREENTRLVKAYDALMRHDRNLDSEHANPSPEPIVRDNPMRREKKGGDPFADLRRLWRWLRGRA